MGLQLGDCLSIYLSVCLSVYFDMNLYAANALTCFGQFGRDETQDVAYALFAVVHMSQNGRDRLGRCDDNADYT